MADIKSRFKGVTAGGAQTQFFEAGNYVARSEMMRLFKDRQGTSQFSVECTVLESDNPAVRAGCRRSYMIEDKNDNQGFILGIVMAFAGMDPTVPLSEDDIKDLEATFETFVEPPDPKKGIAGNGSKGQCARVYAAPLVKNGKPVVTRKGAPYIAARFLPYDPPQPVQ